MEDEDFIKFNIGTKGFAYWIYAIGEFKANKTEILQIYKTLAEKEGKTWQYIEGSMKYTRKNSDRYIRNYFNYSGRLTNRIILNLIKL